MSENGKVGCELLQTPDPGYPRGRVLGGLTTCLGGGAWEEWHWDWPAQGLQGHGECQCSHGAGIGHVTRQLWGHLGSFSIRLRRGPRSVSRKRPEDHGWMPRG